MHTHAACHWEKAQPETLPSHTSPNSNAPSPDFNPSSQDSSAPSPDINPPSPDFNAPSHGNSDIQRKIKNMKDQIIERILSCEDLSTLSKINQFLEHDFQPSTDELKNKKRNFTPQIDFTKKKTQKLNNFESAYHPIEALCLSTNIKEKSKLNIPESVNKS